MNDVTKRYRTTVRQYYMCIKKFYTCKKIYYIKIQCDIGIIIMKFYIFEYTKKKINRGKKEK